MHRFLAFLLILGSSGTSAAQLRVEDFSLLTRPTVAKTNPEGCDCKECVCDPCDCAYKTLYRYVMGGKEATLYVGIKPTKPGKGVFYIEPMKGIKKGVYRCWLGSDGNPRYEPLAPVSFQPMFAPPPQFHFPAPAAPPPPMFRGGSGRC